ncbi:MAG: hypothetical protein ACYTDY_18420 [Planctomycetota bacterium]|jgi:hypothetical protein
MPLSFETVNRGTIAFGFFNIETDMLLLERHFFFADMFCEQVSEVARADPRASFRRMWRVHTIGSAEDVGDLAGAIHGIRHTGFIGETYRRYPFPARPEEFRQKPEGFQTRAVVGEMVRKYAVEEEVPFSGDSGSEEVSIGDYRFTREGFHALVLYVWRGGYPRWRDEERPPYVLDLKAAIVGRAHWLLGGLDLPGTR